MGVTYCITFCKRMGVTYCKKNQKNQDTHQLTSIVWSSIPALRQVLRALRKSRRTGSRVAV